MRYTQSRRQRGFQWSVFLGGPVIARVRTESRALAQRVDSNALFICAFFRRIVGLVVYCLPGA